VQDKTGSFVKPLAARKNRHWGGMWRYFFEKKISPHASRFPNFKTMRAASESFRIMA